MLNSAWCAADQLIFQLCRGMPFQLWSLLSTPTMANATKISRLPRCMCGAFLLGFLKIYDSPAKLLSLEVAIILFCAGQLIHWEIIRIECSHALSRKWTRSHQTVGMSLVELSARHVLTKFKTNFGFLRVAAGKRSSRAPPPPRTRVRKKGKFKGSQTGGGGPQRAFFSQRLKGVSTNNKDEKSAT